jgi:hypothetical protein
VKTPYDTALRVTDRQLDQVRAAIGQAIDELQRVEQAQREIDAAMRRESVASGSDHRMLTEHFFVRARADRQRLRERRALAHAQLEELRRQAVDCYGSRTAIENAAGTFREEALRLKANAEQMANDDRVGARAGRFRRTSPLP